MFYMGLFSVSYLVLNKFKHKPFPIKRKEHPFQIRAIDIKITHDATKIRQQTIY